MPGWRPAGGSASARPPVGAGAGGGGSAASSPGVDGELVGARGPGRSRGVVSLPPQASLPPPASPSAPPSCTRPTHRPPLGHVPWPSAGQAESPWTGHQVLVPGLSLGHVSVTFWASKPGCTGTSSRVLWALARPRPRARITGAQRAARPGSRGPIFMSDLQLPLVPPGRPAGPGVMAGEGHWRL